MNRSTEESAEVSISRRDTQAIIRTHRDAIRLERRFGVGKMLAQMNMNISALIEAASMKNAVGAMMAEAVSVNKALAQPLIEAASVKNAVGAMMAEAQRALAAPLIEVATRTNGVTVAGFLKSAQFGISRSAVSAMATWAPSVLSPSFLSDARKAFSAWEIEEQRVNLNSPQETLSLYSSLADRSSKELGAVLSDHSTIAESPVTQAGGDAEPVDVRLIAVLLRLEKVLNRIDREGSYNRAMFWATLGMLILYGYELVRTAVERSCGP